MNDSALCECHREEMVWHRDTRMNVGGSWRCAVKERERKRIYRENNLEKIRDYQRSWRAKNPEKDRQHLRTYREKNREQLRERGREEYRRNRETKVAYWHRADGGYIRRRKRQLAAQRASLAEQLHQIEEEINLVVES